MIKKYIDEMKSYENPEKDFYIDTMPIESAIDILERFEVDMINELTCEELLKLKNGDKRLSEVKETTSGIY